jgi:3-methylcrotonyl-CoA carboxylase alpha subunit
VNCQKERTLKNEYTVDEKTYHLTLESSRSGVQISIDGTSQSFHHEEFATGRFIVEKDGARFRVVVKEVGDRTYAWVNGRVLMLERPKTETTASITGSSDSHLTAPMPGTLLKLLVVEGQSVETKQTVAILEAMKMEHSLRAPRAGKVGKIFYKEGDVLEADATVLDLEPLKEETS